MWPVRRDRGNTSPERAISRGAANTGSAWQRMYGSSIRPRCAARLQLSLGVNLNETARKLPAKTTCGWTRSGKVSERLDEGFKRQRTFVGVNAELATIDEAQRTSTPSPQRVTAGAAGTKSRVRSAKSRWKPVRPSCRLSFERRHAFERDARDCARGCRIDRVYAGFEIPARDYTACLRAATQARAGGEEFARTCASTGAIASNTSSNETSEGAVCSGRRNSFRGDPPYHAESWIAQARAYGRFADQLRRCAPARAVLKTSRREAVHVNQGRLAGSEGFADSRAHEKLPTNPPGAPDAEDENIQPKVSQQLPDRIRRYRSADTRRLRFHRNVVLLPEDGSPRLAAAGLRSQSAQAGAAGTD